MDIANLRAFIAVVERGSFSQAANDLFITQPAVSKRISALEQSLGHTVFDRISRRAVLTPAGETLLPSARRVLAELESCQSHLDSLDRKIAGSLQLATSHHIGLRRLPPLLRAFNAQYPQVDLRLHLMDSEDAVARVADNSLELAVVTLPPNPPSGVQVRPIWLDHLRFAVAPDHPLGQIAQPATQQLAEHTAILPTRGTVTRRVADAVLTAFDLSLPKVMETNYLETNKVLAAAGLGWTLIPESMLDDSLVALDLPDIGATRELGLVLHSQRTLGRAAECFVEMLKGVHAG